MKVKDLLNELEKMDQNSEVVCYTEDETLLDEGYTFKIFLVESVDVLTGERQKGEDHVPTFKLGKSENSKSHVSLNITGNF